MINQHDLRGFAPILILLTAGCASVLAPLAKPTITAEASALRQGTYQLDKDHAALIFEINHLGYSTFIGRFNSFNISLEFDEASPQSARVDAVVDMTSLDVAHPEFAATLTGPDWFDAAKFPQAEFHSTGVTVTGTNTGVMTGDLILHGVTRPITLDITFNGGGRDVIRNAYIAGFSAVGSIKRSDFGVNRFSRLITDDVRVRIEAEFKKN